MTDLLHVLPDFDTKPYAHLLPSLDKALIAVNDLVTLDPQDVAKRAQVPARELRKLVDAIVLALHQDLGFGGGEGGGKKDFLSDEHTPQSPVAISILDEALDAALGGGIRPGYLVEVTGERYVLSVRSSCNPPISNILQRCR